MKFSNLAEPVTITIALAASIGCQETGDCLGSCLAVVTGNWIQITRITGLSIQTAPVE